MGRLLRTTLTGIGYFNWYYPWRAAGVQALYAKLRRVFLLEKAGEPSEKGNNLFYGLHAFEKRLSASR